MLSAVNSGPDAWDDDITDPFGPGGERLHLAEGVELLGRYRGSGLKRAPFLIRRGDGQVVQVTYLIYRIAVGLAAGYPLHQVALRVSQDLGRAVSVENVAYLIDQKLRPAGLIATSEAPSPPPARTDAVLGLRLRVPLVPANVHGTVTRLLVPLFHTPVIALALAGLVALDAWLALAQRDGLAAGLEDIVYRPQLVLLLTGLALVAGAFHETGHATAARYGGASPGAMGAGLYLVWPVFYTDVTDTYRLSRRGRLRTDLGGVYFNVLFTLAMGGVYGATGFRPLLVYLVVAQLETLRQFLPFVRLDGYYVVSDLAGVPNLFAYVQPVLVTVFRRNDRALLAAAEERLGELQPRARRLITAWVLITVPVLLANVVLLIVVLPRLAGAAWGSAAGQWHQVVGGGEGGELDLLAAANGVVGLCLLGLPVVGMIYVMARLVERVIAAAQALWQSRPTTATVLTVGLSALAAWQVGFVWPETFGAALQDAEKATIPEISTGAMSDRATAVGVIGDIAGDTGLTAPSEPAEPPVATPVPTQPATTATAPGPTPTTGAPVTAGSAPASTSTTATSVRPPSQVTTIGPRPSAGGGGGTTSTTTQPPPPPRTRPVSPPTSEPPLLDAVVGSLIP